MMFTIMIIDVCVFLTAISHRRQHSEHTHTLNRFWIICLL